MFIRLVAFVATASSLSCGVASATLSRVDDSTTFHVPASVKHDLQTLLDRYGSITLDANADYRTHRHRFLTVSTGQRIVGGWNTRIPRIVIPGGVSNVFISGVRSDGWTAPDIEFIGGEENSNIEIIGGSGGPGTHIRVSLRPGARVKRLTLSEYGGLEVQQASSGYVRDSTFTRLIGYWPGPHVVWRGNAREPSYGNAFLGIASITPATGSIWRDAGDLWLVGWDCESWNGNGKGSVRCFSIEGATRVVSVSLSGGTAYPERGGALASMRNVRELISWFRRGHGGHLDGASVLVDGVGTMLSVQDTGIGQVREINAPDSAVRLRLFDRSNNRDTTMDTVGAFADDAAHRTALRSALSGSLGSTGLAKPRRRILKDALGPNWRKHLATQPDASARIQAEIDVKAIARLTRGVYYLDRPLKIGSPDRVEGLLGDDRDGVYLVAKGAFPIIEGRGRKIGNGATSGGDSKLINLVLAGFTLYGGTHGIHWSGATDNLGPLATIAWSSFYDLKFMNQSVSGVNVVGIHGIDSNLWHRVDFADVPVAFNGIGSGVGAGMNYADKQHFLDCQYHNVSGTVWHWLSDRASGGEVWKDNFFFNVGGLTRTRAANNLLWINSVMEDVTGKVAIDVTDEGSTATYYFTMIDSLWRGRGPAVVTDTQSWGVGTLFIDTTFAQSGGSIVAPTGDNTLFAWGSRITGSAAVGAVHSGAFINSSMGSYDKTMQVIKKGAVLTVLPADVTYEN